MTDTAEENLCSQLRQEYESLISLKGNFERAFENGITARDFSLTDDPKEKIKTKIRELHEKIFANPETAKRILGQDYLGPEAIKEVFGVEIKPEDVPKIPFRNWELERAKELNQFLVLRVDRAPDGEALTVEKMKSLFRPEEIFRGYYEHYPDDDCCRKDTPRFGWAITDKEVLTSSLRKDYFGQMAIAIDYLKEKVFGGKRVPDVYRTAIDEFTSQVASIKMLAAEDGAKANRKIAQLKIEQLIRRTVIEVIYDLLIYHRNSNSKLLKDAYTTTRASRYDDPSVNGKIIGRFHNSGVSIEAGGDVFLGQKIIGLCFSRCS